MCLKESEMQHSTYQGECLPDEGLLDGEVQRTVSVERWAVICLYQNRLQLVIQEHIEAQHLKALGQWRPELGGLHTCLS